MKALKTGDTLPAFKVAETLFADNRRAIVKYILQKKECKVEV